MTATEWVENYKKAWVSNDPDDIRALFTLDGIYKGSPNDAEPARGQDEVAEWWIGNSESPNDYSFEYWVVIENDEYAVVQNVTDYASSGGETWDNLWVIRWGADGRAEEFTEWAKARH